MKALSKLLIFCVFSLALASCGEKAPPPPAPDPVPTADDAADK